MSAPTSAPTSSSASTSSSTSHRTAPPGARRHAWLWLASTPLFFVVGFAVCEGLAALLGLQDGDVPTFSWREVLVLVVGLVILAIPAGGAVAEAGHAPRDVPTQVPYWILVTLVLFVLLTNVIGFVIPPPPD